MADELSNAPSVRLLSFSENHMTPEERAALIAKIAALPQQLAAVISPLSDEQLLARPLAGEWSVAQNVHHLADSHMTSFIRVRLMLTQENPAFTPYSPDAYADLPDASKAETGDSMDLLRGLHARWVLLWQSLSEEQWARTGYHPESGRTYTLNDILRTYGNHGEAHLDQIARTLAAQ